MLFFQLINARHERASTVLTSNKGFDEWGQVLGRRNGDGRALIDRLLLPLPHRQHPRQQLPDARPSESSRDPRGHRRSAESLPREQGRDCYRSTAGTGDILGRGF